MFSCQLVATAGKGAMVDCFLTSAFIARNHISFKNHPTWSDLPNSYHLRVCCNPAVAFLQMYACCIFGCIICWFVVVVACWQNLSVVWDPLSFLICRRMCFFVDVKVQCGDENNWKRSQESEHQTRYPSFQNSLFYIADSTLAVNQLQHWNPVRRQTGHLKLRSLLRWQNFPLNVVPSRHEVISTWSILSTHLFFNFHVSYERGSLWKHSVRHI